MKFIHPDGFNAVTAIAAFGSLLWTASWYLDKPLPEPINTLAVACIGVLLGLPLAKDRRRKERKDEQ